MKKSLSNLRSRSKAIKEGNRGEPHTLDSGNITKHEKSGKSALEDIRTEFKGRIFSKVQNVEDREKLTLKLMENFKKSLAGSVSQEDREKKSQKKNRVLVCGLHSIDNCESCAKLQDDNDSSDEDWMGRPLVFKTSVSADVYEPKVADYTVLDPREADIDDFLPKDVKVSKRSGSKASRR